MSSLGPIVCAGDRDLPPLTDVPDMRDAVTGMSAPITLVVYRIKAGKLGDAELVKFEVETEGFLRPSSAKELKIKDEGEGTRRWSYWALYVLNEPDVQIQDKIEFGGNRYSVVNSTDRRQHGFSVLGLTEDFR